MHWDSGSSQRETGRFLVGLEGCAYMKTWTIYRESGSLVKRSGHTYAHPPSPGRPPEAPWLTFTPASIPVVDTLKSR